MDFKDDSFGSIAVLLYLPLVLSFCDLTHVHKREKKILEELKSQNRKYKHVLLKVLQF